MNYEVRLRRVRRGVALLDGEGPWGWRTLISTDRLDVESFRHCLLGQLYGGYTEGKRILAPEEDLEFMRAHGLHCTMIDEVGGTCDAEELTEIWRAVLRGEVSECPRTNGEREPVPA